MENWQKIILQLSSNTIFICSSALGEKKAMFTVTWPTLSKTPTVNFFSTFSKKYLQNKKTDKAQKVRSFHK